MGVPGKIGIYHVLALAVSVLWACTAVAGPTSGGGQSPSKNSTALPAVVHVVPSPPAVAPTPSPSLPPTPMPATALGELATVTRVVDGDTIDARLSSGRVARVRFIGIDTPETVDPNRPVGCYGPEASNRTKALLSGQQVRLEKDVSETDRYGRLLRYIWLGDLLVNESLVRDGYAVVTTYPPDVKYVDRFLAAQRAARDAGAGLWGACGGSSSPAPTSAPPVAPTSGMRAGCDPSYPDVCVPPPPPDLTARTSRTGSSACCRRTHTGSMVTVTASAASRDRSWGGRATARTHGSHRAAGVPYSAQGSTAILIASRPSRW